MESADREVVERLGQLLIEMEQPTWADTRRFVSGHPDLYSDAGIRVVEFLRDLSVETGDDTFTQTLDERLILLRRCRDVGIENAFKERVPEGYDPASPEAAHAIELQRRYEDEGDRDSLDEAVAVWERILGAPGFQSSPAARLARELAGTTYVHRYHASGNRKDLERALTLYREAVEQTPDDSPFLPDRLNTLASGLRERSVLLGDVNDLDGAISLWQRALTLRRPNARMSADYWNGLGNALQDRFMRGGTDADLEAAVAAYRAAVNNPSVPADAQPRYLTSLASGLTLMARRTGEVVTVRAAVDAATRCLALLSERSPQRPASLSILGDAQVLLYQFTGNRAALDDGVASHELAVREAKAVGGQAGSLSSGLAGALHARYNAVGSRADIDRCVELGEEVLAALPDGHSDRGEFLDVVGSALASRFRLSRSRADLDRAIEYHEEAVRLSKVDGRSRVARRANLSNALMERFHADGNMSDLNAAITLLEEALQDAVGPGDRAAASSNLAAALRDRADISSRQADLQRAVALFEDALNLEADGSPRLPGMLHNLAGALRASRPQARGPSADIRIRDLSRRACKEGLSAAPAMALMAALDWGDDESSMGNAELAAEAYGYGLEALHLLFATQSDWKGKEDWLKRAQDLPARAAVAYAGAGAPERAVMALEEGRALILTETLDRRGDALLPLKIINGHLWQRYLDAASTLRQLQTLESDAEPIHLQRDDLPVPDSGRLSEQLGRAHLEFERVVLDVRKLPGFERFLERPTFDDIAWHELDSPVAYVAGSPDGGIAIVVRPDEGLSVRPLPGLGRRRRSSADDTLQGIVEEYLSAYQRWTDDSSGGDRDWVAALDKTTAWLGDNVMRPLLGDVDGAPRLIVIGAGWLSLLPLHAAWWSDPEVLGGRCYVLDRVTLTYAPNVRMLLASKGRGPAAHSGPCVAVENPTTDLDDLPGASGEVQALASRFGDAIVRLRGNDATRAAVTSLLEEASHVHLACHAFAQPLDPLESSVVLAGGDRLTLRDLLEVRTSARLAVLSACETAIPGTNVVDEVVGLPVGFMQAGAAAIIGSLWRVPDLPTMVLMIRFYELWGSERAPFDAFAEAQTWLRTISTADAVEWLGTLSHLDLTLDQTGPIYLAAADSPSALAFPLARDWAGFAYFGL